MQVALALFVWAVLILVGTFFGSVRHHGRETSTRLNRFLAMVFIVPSIGFVFWILGFVGSFLLSPIFALFR